ncbi:MAG: hypothetical protein PHV32_16930 [Eubacteriales bacterium]|nr:hypothetical protein [Eubacteriales bacterium]
MQGCNLSACQGSIKKRKQELQLSLAAFLFLENKSDKSQGLGQSPKVLTGNFQCSLIRECHCRKTLETTNKRALLSQPESVGLYVNCGYNCLFRKSWLFKADLFHSALTSPFRHALPTLPRDEGKKQASFHSSSTFSV